MKTRATFVLEHAHGLISISRYIGPLIVIIIGIIIIIYHHHHHYDCRKYSSCCPWLEYRRYGKRCRYIIDVISRVSHCLAQ
jgi:hypothetical protein